MLRLFDLSGNEQLILRSKGRYIAGEATEIKVTEDLIGIPELTFVLPVSIILNGVRTENQRWIYVQSEMLIKYTDYKNSNKVTWFRIKTLEDQHSQGKLTSNIQCKSIAFDLGKRGMDKVIDLTDSPTVVLTSILSGSGWTLGTVDTSLNTKIRAFTADSRSNILELLNSAAELYTGYLRFNTDVKTVDLLTEIGDINKQVSMRYKKNLKQISRVCDTTELVTRLYIYGGEDSSGTIGIESVNPNKQPFIQNFSYFITSGLMPASSTPTITQYDSDMLAVNTNILATQALIDAENVSIISKQAQIATKQIQVTSLTQLITEIDNKLAVYQSTDAEYTVLVNEKAGYNSDKSTLEGEITTLQGEVSTHQANIVTYTATLNGYQADKIAYETQFQIDMNGFLFEGVWQDSNYTSATPTELYNDGVTLLAKSAIPQYHFQ